MKKVFVCLTVAGLLVMIAGPALASGPDGNAQVVVGNWAVVHNYVGAVSDTGGNGIANSSNWCMGVGGNISSNNDGNVIKTGDANSYVESYVAVNSNVAMDGCCGPEDQIVDWNYAYLDNTVMAMSNTGGNGIANSENDGMWVGGNISSNNDDNVIKTGDANSYVESYVAVNSNVALDGWCCSEGWQYVGGEVGNGADVYNEIIAGAMTGENGIANSSNGDMGIEGSISSNNDGNTINTGDAVSGVYSIVVVNSNIVRSW
ncbi:hypothetical protein J7K42_01270 [bacterium]|nr:hypothetical protein [bacterium]